MNSDQPSAADGGDAVVMTADAEWLPTTQGDFTADRRLLWLVGLAIPVGVASALVALVLQRLIGLVTNISFYQRFTVPEHLPSPTGNALGWLVILVPAAGGLIVGLMARYGSEKIRGHGIPEAIESILLGGSRMEPRVAVLKPLSSAISIGSGGPFGAEGPIIMTGGAFGSIFAQIFRLTPAERKTLLVAGAAGGLAGIFGTPVAAVLLAIELLLFEWKPRSLIPVSIASAIATLMRPYLHLGGLPLIEVPVHSASPTMIALFSATIVGLSAGALSLLLATLIYASEKFFHRLPIHWMWWPMIGGLVVGVGGYLDSRTLGPGYPVIEDVLRGNYLAGAVIGVLIIKALIWSFALGSETSGGTLAPLLLMGAILGLIEANFLPGHDTRLWALVGMGAILGGTLRAPLTGVIFGLEATYDVRALLPLLIGSIVSYGFTVLMMKRSILTESLARLGHHVSQEFSVDPLERLLVSQVMSVDVVSVPGKLPVRDLALEYFTGHGPRKHQGYPVVDDAGRVLGVVTKTDLLDGWMASLIGGGDAKAPYLSHIITYDLVNRPPITIGPDQTCAAAAVRMTQAGVGRLLVITKEHPGRVVGILTRSDIFKSRARHSEEELLRERFIGTRFARGGKRNLPKSA